ncbi:MAG: hypothetical protein IT369_01275 [Candidatus Latescibacteria bacterium]|nr:hypothetical protein [Candidatus Latescibacterota bacterium]
MALSAPPRTTADLPGQAPAWRELAGLCDTLRILAAEVASSLQQGAGAGVLVPLLRKELELARSLQEGIARCGQQPSTVQSRAHSQELSIQLGSLLETETANQSLLKRRGIRLRGPRSPHSRLNGP